MPDETDTDLPTFELHVVRTDAPWSLRARLLCVSAVRAVRGGLGYAPEANDLETARDLVDQVREHGHALIARSPDMDAIGRAADQVTETSSGLLAPLIDPDDELIDAAVAPAPVDDDEDEIPVSVEAYQTGIAMVSIFDGKPITAAIHALTLARTTGDSVFHEVVAGLIEVYPMIEPSLMEAGLWPAEPIE